MDDVETEGLVIPVRALRVLEAVRGMAGELDGLAPDRACRERLVGAHRASLIEAASAVTETLVAEMVRLHMAPLARDATVAEVRVAQAQLAGWLTGLIRSGGLVSGEPVVADDRPLQTTVAGIGAFALFQDCRGAGADQLQADSSPPDRTLAPRCVGLLPVATGGGHRQRVTAAGT